MSRRAWFASLCLALMALGYGLIVAGGLRSNPDLHVLGLVLASSSFFTYLRLADGRS